MKAGFVPAAGAGAESPASALFTVVWDEMSEALGTAATAAIIRRASSLASAGNPELAELVVARSDLEYGYSLPPVWHQRGDRVPPALQALVTEIGKLLVELTGTVLVRRLEQVPQLRACGITWRTEKAN